MESLHRAAASRRMLMAILRPQNQLRLQSRAHPLSRPRAMSATSIRHAPRATTDPSKPIELEQPDKFRPPSHPQRLGRRLPRHYPGPSISEAEREEQRTRSYPHMFPNPGTWMHWFLTAKWLHLCISLGVLTFLATITMIETFLHTSPYAHLLPPISSFPFHPLSYLSEAFSVWRLHIDYTTEVTAEKRRQNLLDSQKRRIYRRAHGLENLDPEEGFDGLDVRGVVPWDDGLTVKERQLGGRRLEYVTGQMIADVGGNPLDYMDESGKLVISETEAKRLFAGRGFVIEGPIGGSPEYEPKEEPKKEEEKSIQEKPRRKKWLGIWG